MKNVTLIAIAIGAFTLPAFAQDALTKAACGTNGPCYFSAGQKAGIKEKTDSCASGVVANPAGAATTGLTAGLKCKDDMSCFYIEGVANGKASLSCK